MSTLQNCIINRNRTIAESVNTNCTLNLEGSSGPSGDDCTGKRKFVATNNIAIKITEQLAGTAANGSAAAADEETVGAGAGQGGADAVDKSPAQDSETNLKVNFVVLEVISD